ncbi:MAG: hypothetical protein ACYCW6_02120 [Candidatus Xenobia bacterium]
MGTRPGPRGMALITAFYVAAIVLLLGFTVAQLASFQYLLSRHTFSQQQSLRAAQSGLALAQYYMSKDPDWGKGSPWTALSGAFGDGHYQMTFDPGQPQFSVNNLKSSVTAAGWQGRVVPPFSADLICKGTDMQGTDPRILEVIAQFPAYPYALAASGDITANNGITVLGANNLQAPPGPGGITYPPVSNVLLTRTLPQILGDPLLDQDVFDTPGNVLAASNNSPAMAAAGSIYVSGEIRSAGAVSLTPGARVENGVVAIEPGSEQVPDVDITSFNDSKFQGVITVVGNPYAAATPSASPSGSPSPSSSPSAGSTPSSQSTDRGFSREVAGGGPSGWGAMPTPTPPRVLSGPVYCSQDFVGYDVVLNNAWVYVDASFTVQHSLTGTGTIFVTGNTNLVGSSTLDSASGIAVFSGGDLALAGKGYFQGVLYSHGNITINDGITVLGSILAEGDTAGNGSITLGGNVEVCYIPEYSKFGTPWVSRGVQGHLLLGKVPTMQAVFFREAPP